MTIYFRTEGKMSTFGGPADTGMTAQEGLALFNSEQDVKNHGLENFLLSPEEAGAPGLGRRLNPTMPYVACRWWDAGLNRELVRNSWVWVQNSKTGKRMKAKPVDYGPAAWTNRIADLSPGLARDLGLATNDICSVTLSDEESSEFGIEINHALVGEGAGPAALSGPRIHTTTEWGARAPRVSQFPEKPGVGAVIHNTQGSNREPLEPYEKERDAAYATARSIQKDHMDRKGWNDTGQHFTISQGGIIMEGRHGTLAAARAGHVVRGAHAPRANDEWWGIELAGDNRAEDKLTDAQWDSLVELCAWLDSLIPGNLQVQPHKHFTDTDCPGKLAGRIERLANALAQLRSAPGGVRIVDRFDSILRAQPAPAAVRPTAAGRGGRGAPK